MAGVVVPCSPISVVNRGGGGRVRGCDFGDGKANGPCGASGGSELGLAAAASLAAATRLGSACGHPQSREESACEAACSELLAILLGALEAGLRGVSQRLDDCDEHGASMFCSAGAAASFTSAHSSCRVGLFSHERVICSLLQLAIQLALFRSPTESQHTEPPTEAEQRLLGWKADAEEQAVAEVAEASVQMTEQANQAHNNQSQTNQLRAHQAHGLATGRSAEMSHGGVRIGGGYHVVAHSQAAAHAPGVCERSKSATDRLHEYRRDEVIHSSLDENGFAHGAASDTLPADRFRVGVYCMTDGQTHDDPPRHGPTQLFRVLQPATHSACADIREDAAIGTRATATVGRGMVEADASSAGSSAAALASSSVPRQNSHNMEPVTMGDRGPGGVTGGCGVRRSNSAAPLHKQSALATAGSFIPPGRLRPKSATRSKTVSATSRSGSRPTSRRIQDPGFTPP
eukprot:TRINITY_DN33214_c0_g1_i1.p1 TRINITY_DN33214_c0_g1~~TRINITY_DN33214_c0_g1_i1.p1  ORF type:complete len:474 (-),score=59.74 TRINITY_DN33214_c0_g1_i1:314-1690(-)